MIRKSCGKKYSAAIYKRRKLRETSQWILLDHHFWEFEQHYDDLFQQQYGFFRQVISHVVSKD
jgi:hypothetical protein